MKNLLVLVAAMMATSSSFGALTANSLKALETSGFEKINFGPDLEGEIKCSKLTGNADAAFKLIQQTDGSGLRAFLSANPASKTARNENCETMYHAAIHYRNKVAKGTLEALNLAPKTELEINAPDEKLTINYYDHALIYSSMEMINDLRKKGGKFSPKYGSELLLAATANSKEVLTALIAMGVDVNKTSANGTSALMVSVAYKNNEAVDVLIAAGADVNLKYVNGKTALHMAACENPSKQVIEALIKAGSDINTKDKNLTTPIMCAAGLNSVDVVEATINAGADLTARDAGGIGALQWASAFNKIEVVKILLKAGLPINAQDSSGSTALIAAAESNSAEVVDFLLKSGADHKIRSSRGQNALNQAAAHNDAKVVDTLIRAGAMVNEKIPGNDFKHQSTLIYASSNPRTEVFKILLSAGADINATDDLQSNVLCYASFANTNKEVVGFLIDSGLNVNTRCTSYSFTPLMTAAQGNSIEIIQYLIQRGADRSAVTTDGQSAYFIASRYSRGDEILRLLR